MISQQRPLAGIGAAALHTSTSLGEDKEKSVLEKAVDNLKEEKHEKVHHHCMQVHYL